MLAAVALIGAAACDDSNDTSGVPSELVYVSGTGQTGNVGALLPAPLVVEVLTADDEPVEGIELRWVVTGGGALNDNTTNTDEQGRSSVTFTLGPVAGAQSVQVSAPGLPIGDVVFNFVATDPGDGEGGDGEL
jgi:hypothetical protein